MIAFEEQFGSVGTAWEDAASEDAAWEDYEAFVEQVGDASGRRLCFDEGAAAGDAPSPEHEKYVRFIERLASTLSLRLRIRTTSFGSATMGSREQRKRSEPDPGCTLGPVLPVVVLLEVLL